MSRESYVRDLIGTQLRPIADLAASLACLQVLCEVGRLSERRARQEHDRQETETETGCLHPKILPETSFHVVHLVQNPTLEFREPERGEEVLVSANMIAQAESI
jgi:hypothetical protein